MAKHGKKVAKSPYQRYGKSPFRYSEAYRDWFRAAKSGDRGAMEREGRRHSAAFSLTASRRSYDEAEAA